MPVKRLLSIDGGGIRGVIAAEILLKMEEALREYNPKCQRLSDYFDFICGTSTGSILATGLAVGMSADQLLEIYKQKGKLIFTKEQHTWNQLLQSLDSVTGCKRKLVSCGRFLPEILKKPLLEAMLNKYTARELENQLKQTFADAQGNPLTLGSSDLKTNLMVVTKNATTGKPCFFVNNTRRESCTTNRNLHTDAINPFLQIETDPNIPLWHIVRASSAAPTYFPPHRFDVYGKPSEFIDGGVSSYNNASFQLFLTSILPEFGTGWEYGSDKILLVSIGTGFNVPEIELDKASTYNNLDWAKYAINDLMEDANLQQNLLLKLMSEQRKRGEQKLENNPFQDQKLLSYCRFTTSFTKERFQQLGLPNDINPKDVEGMDCVDKIDELSLIGKAVAKEQFDLNLFKGFLDDVGAENNLMLT